MTTRAESRSAAALQRPDADAVVPDDWGAAVELLRSAAARGDVVLCVGHIQPDGDALGCALALARALRWLGADAHVSFDPGPLTFGMPASLDFLPGVDLLVAPDDAPVPDLLVTTDTGSPDRLGVLAGLVASHPTLVIDHHASALRFGSCNLIDSSAAATAEMVADLIDQLGAPLDADMAQCLYVGLASDTGSFRYAATSARTHRLAARLLEVGVRPADVSQELWDSRPAGYLTLLTRALDRLVFDGQLAWTSVQQADLVVADVGPEEAEGIIDVIRSVREVEVAAVLKEDADGSWRVSVRSRGHCDVGAACTALGGGGHRLAAGFTSTETPEQTIARFKAVLVAQADGQAPTG